MSAKKIQPEEALTHLKDGWVYLDVRTTEEFAAGHPEGAYNVPLLQQGPGGMAPNPEFLKVVEANFEKDAKLVVGCKAGGRSAKACALLEQAGYSNLLDQTAGYLGKVNPFSGQQELGWHQKELPTKTEALEGRDYDALKGHA